MLRDHHAEASRLLAAVRDIVDERALGPAPPSWSVRRGWDCFLGALSDDEVDLVEREGLAACVASLPGAPDDLRSLAADVARLTALPRASATPGPDVDPRRASPRKRAQVSALAALVRPFGLATARVVDVGAGHGHLTRHLARSLDVQAIGWERDAERVAVATSLAGALDARFVTIDVRDAAASLRRGDLVVGLHACGELGDLAVRAAQAVGAGVALIGCCFQKREGNRPPLVEVPGVDLVVLTLGRATLGLANACDREDGVEDDLAARTAARVHRLALRALLLDAGHPVQPGEEMRGTNRRRAHDLDGLVARAFAVRGLPPPSGAAVAESLRGALARHHRSRRWELPRTMLARFVEVWIALDRAAFLAEAGGGADAVIAFDGAVSPRNVAVRSWGR